MTVMLGGVLTYQMGGRSTSVGHKGDPLLLTIKIEVFVFSNDIDTVGVRAGCTLTGFSEDGYTGDSISISAGITER